MSYIRLDNVKNPKHTTVLKKLSDIFDNSRGKISENIAVTFFNNFNGNHNVVFNTESPEHNGKQLVSIGSEGLLYSVTDIDSLLCSDPQNNLNIAVLKDPKNSIVWEAVSDDKNIRIQIILKEPKSTVNALGIVFTDAVKTNYNVNGIFVNGENQVVSEFNNIRSSTDTNTQQFIQLQNKIEDVSKIILDIEVLNTNIYEWKLKNISIYSHMNLESMRLMKESGMITWTLVPNPVLIKGYDPKEFESERLNVDSKEPGLGTILKTIPEEKTGFYDKNGTPLPYKPNLKMEHIDELDLKKITKIAKVPYAVNKSINGGEMFTIETKPEDGYHVKFTLSPTEQLNKQSDNAEIQMDKLIQKGYIKYGGFKNYILTFYVKLDKIVMEDQYLMWKYGGWIFDKNIPDCARATAVCIPIGDLPTEQPPKLRFYTEYVYNKWHDITPTRDIHTTIGTLPEGKWIGIQFIRQVESPTKSIQTIRFNYNPFDDDGKLTNNQFEEVFRFIDETTEGHTANTWGGVNEIISISGAKYVNIYGLSLYEIE